MEHIFRHGVFSYFRLIFNWIFIYDNIWFILLKAVRINVIAVQMKIRWLFHIG